MTRDALEWKRCALGAAFSILLTMLVARKWKLPRRPVLLGAAVSACLAAGAFLRLYPRCRTRRAVVGAMLGQIGLALACSFALAMERFWRDPERVPPDEEGLILSPADGKVVYARTIDSSATPLVKKRGRDYLLTELMETSLADCGSHVIGVEMNLLNVHVNRCPISGQVRSVNHIGGKFISLGKDEAPFVNERCTTVIENAALPVATVQVASRLVRRIDTYLSEGQTVSAGQRLGMIRFGSLVAVVLPKREDVSIEVKTGDQVKAGISILARHRVNAVAEVGVEK